MKEIILFLLIPILISFIYILQRWRSAIKATNHPFSILSKKEKFRKVQLMGLADLLSIGFAIMIIVIIYFLGFK